MIDPYPHLNRRRGTCGTGAQPEQQSANRRVKADSSGLGWMKIMTHGSITNIVRGIGIALGFESGKNWSED
jgi:hypothetical protein